MNQPDERDPLCWGWNPVLDATVDATSVAPGPDATQVWASAAPNPATITRAAPLRPGRLAAGRSGPPLASFMPHGRGPIGADLDPTVEGPGDLIGADPGDDEPVASRRPKGDVAGSFPRPGDGIAGYRLLSELGRGTFGRVFLAEEALLGNRLVALKITRAEGDEPRILARLQHTNIVPIHSVHDDPRTGLRVMCMPYVGGANLAQILDAAAEARPNETDRRSLLRALDIVGLPPPSEVFGPSGVPRRRSSPPSSAPPGGPTPEAPGDPPGGPGSLVDTRVAGTSPAGAGSSEGGRRSSRELRRSLLGRLPRWSESFGARGSGPRGAVPAAADREPVQPARQFLREASFVRAAAWVVARLAEGLEHAHARGLLHRDLKPSNILIAADGTPMLLDFNLAADLTARLEDDDEARMGGTLPYMSPEHLDAFHPEGTTAAERVDERSDIYALGLILFEMIAGRRPFAESTPGRPILDEIRAMIAERTAGAPSLRAACPRVPRDLDAVVRKALHPDPDRRHARAGDLAEDLRRFLDDLPLRHAAEPTAWGRAAKWVRRNPRATGASTVGLVGLALIIGLSAAAWSVTRHLNLASARLRLKGFEARFPECQFLLNTGVGPVDALGRGIDLARETLGQAGVALDRADRAGAGGWLDVLPAEESREVRRDLAELILLIARARVYLVDRAGGADKGPAIEQAIAWLDRAEALDPSPTLTLYDDRAAYLARAGHADRAAADRARRDRLSPSTGRDFYLLGTALMTRGKLDKAEAALIRATSLNPQDFWSWFGLGICHYDQRRFTEAAGDFTVSSVLAPRFAWPWMNRGLALARAGRLIEARASYDHALAIDDSMGDALAKRGLVALELGDAPAALADLTRAVELGHRDVDLQASLGEALGRAGRPEDAIRQLDRLIAGRPDAVSPRLARAALLLAIDPAAAEADYLQVLGVAPRHPRALLGLARLQRADDPAGALRRTTLALEADPGLLDAVELAVLLRGKLGDPAVIEDVDRLTGHPTPHRLYNAACGLAQYVARHPDPELADRAIAYLRRAVETGIPAAQLRDDPDLASLRPRPAFRALLPGPEPGAPATAP